MWWKKRNKPEQTISQDDLDWVKETLARLLIENGVLRLVTAHLIVAKCKETEDPQLAFARSSQGARCCRSTCYRDREASWRAEFGRDVPAENRRTDHGSRQAAFFG